MPSPGEQLGSFTLEEPIGVGGMGAVFLATDTRLRRQVALKILPPEQAEDPENVQRFYQEGQSAAQLDHENIARVYTIDADRGYHFIAFEYIEGTTIRQKVEHDGILSVAETINYTLQIANALIHAAERGVVHRDIKPSNIIVTAQGRAKLVDMGLARRFERGVTDDGLTQSGMTLGTFDYISPEQARDPRDVDVRSDLYSLGCTLFHMLTGQPPFPEGTVLQKLLQHQEEPAPDVRALNPEVPADLAAILLKLMEKDRDRRYQNPEQLVRDLLALAGALGLRSISPEGLVWMSNTPAASWERHLVWGLPTIGFAILVSTLIWWGQTPGQAPINLANDPIGPPPLPAGSDSPTVEPPRITPPTRARASTGVAVEEPSDPSPAGASQPVRQWLVGSDEDLALAIAKAPNEATLILTDDGPYYLNPTVESHLDADDSATGRDLTIQAGANARPVIQASREPADGADEAALLAFRGGRVRLEGITFRLDATDAGRRLAAIAAEDVDLSLSQCAFRRTGSRLGTVILTALSLRSTSPESLDDARPFPTRLVACHIDGGQVGIRVRGRAEVHLRDCTIGAGEPAFWADNAEAESSVPIDLTLQNLRIQAGATPVFQFSRTRASVLLSDSVIATAKAGPSATLIATDAPDEVDWYGRDNLYGGIGTFLKPTGGRSDQPPIHRYALWAGDDLVIRETRSDSVTGSVWVHGDPEGRLALDDEPSDAFQVTNRRPGHAAGDAQRGLIRPRFPNGGVIASLLDSAFHRRSADAPPTDVAEAPNDDASDPTETPPREVEPRNRTGRDAGAPTSAQGDLSDASDAADPASTFPEVNASMTPPLAGPMPIGPPSPMPVSPSLGGLGATEGGSNEPVTVATSPVGPAASVGDMEEDHPSLTEPPGPMTGDRPKDETESRSDEERVGSEDRASAGPAAVAAAEAPALIRTGAELRKALKAAGASGGKLPLASDAEIDLSTIVIPRGGRWTLQAEPASDFVSSRPRIRFRPGPTEARSAGEPSVLFQVASGAALEIQGVDLILAEEDAPVRRRRAAFGIGPGTELVLHRCTVTVQGEPDEPDGAAVVLVRNEAGPNPGLEASGVNVRVSESLLRSGGDIVDVASGIRFDLSLKNTLVAAGGSLLHGRGSVRGDPPEPIKLMISQVTSRTAGGLIRLESSEGEPDLPVVQAVIRDTILATTPSGDPLCVIEGQEGLEALRDRIRWESHGKIIYHQIETYRRDETARSGTSPVGFKRLSWEVAVGAHEDDPYHGDAHFAQPWETGRPLWSLTPDDARLDDEAPNPGVGPDLDLIPAAPPAKADAE